MPVAHLREYQSAVAKRLIRGIMVERAATFTVLFPRQAGKNELSASLVAGLLHIHAREGGSIVVCAPTYMPQALISQRRTIATFARQRRIYGDWLRVERNTLWCGRASAVFLGASPEANVAGHTASIALIGDEAQDIDPEWFDHQFRPMAATTGAPTVLFGTAWHGDTLLDRAVRANRNHDADHPRDLPRHYQVRWEAVAGVLPAYGEYVRAERERLGPDHPLFLSQYELRPAQPGSALLDVAQLGALQGTHARLAAPVAGERYVAALDLGGESANADRSVLTIARVSSERVEVVAHEAWQGAAYEVMLEGVDAAAARWRFEHLAVDATGMGGPVAARLRDLPGTEVEEFSFSTRSKSRLGFGLVSAAATGRLAVYRDDGSEHHRRLFEELRACRATYRAGSRISWGAARGHDDYAVSLALCLHAADVLGPPRVAVGRTR